MISQYRIDKNGIGLDVKTHKGKQHKGSKWLLALSNLEKKEQWEEKTY